MGRLGIGHLVIGHLVILSLVISSLVIHRQPHLRHQAASYPLHGEPGQFQRRQRPRRLLHQGLMHHHLSGQLAIPTIVAPQGLPEPLHQVAVLIAVDVVGHICLLIVAGVLPDHHKVNVNALGLRVLGKPRAGDPATTGPDHWAA